jgi:hypothetical protein
MNPTNKNLFVIAALLASSSAIDLDDLTDEDRVGIKAEFGTEARQTDNGELVTLDDYRVAIERVSIKSDAIDIRVRDEARLDDLLDALTAPTLDVAENTWSPGNAELVLNNVHFEGRVYDDHGRLPGEGLGISGEMPINVVVKRDLESKGLVVAFQVPTHYFDGIDYGMA